MRKRIIYPMDYGNLQLRTKSFLDFTTDPAILDEILGGHSKVDKEEFMRRIEQDRAMTFMYFTDFCKDKKLVQAIEKEFGAEWQSVHNE